MINTILKDIYVVQKIFLGIHEKGSERNKKNGSSYQQCFDNSQQFF